MSDIIKENYNEELVKGVATIKKIKSIYSEIEATKKLIEEKEYHKALKELKHLEVTSDIERFEYDIEMGIKKCKKAILSEYVTEVKRQISEKDFKNHDVASYLHKDYSEEKDIKELLKEYEDVYLESTEK